ncbi:MAG: sensor histidine kinase [Thermoanaerobaculia bacterium]|nr:sensor histidine kinase [Thermoanaerobaculia bacterium]
MIKLSHYDDILPLFRKTAVYFLLALPAWLPAQEGFEDKLNHEQIQNLLSKGIETGDDGMQALGWYKWAIYRETEMGNRDSAFQYLRRSADLFLTDKDTLAYHRVRTELAVRMAERGLVSDAVEIQREARAYFKKTDNRRLETLVLAQMSRLLEMRGDTAEASVLRREFREKSLQLNDTLLLINVFVDEVGYLQGRKAYRDAISMAFRVLDLSEKTGNAAYVTWAEYQIGYLNELNRDYLMSLRFLNRAEKSNPPLDAARRLKIYQHKATVYQKLDSLSQAMDYAQRAISLGDTLLNRYRTGASDRLAVLYGVEEKSRLLEAMTREKKAIEISIRQQRDFFYVLLLFFGAIILALIFIVRDYKHRLYTNRVIAQQNEKINQQTIRQLEDALKIESMQSMLEGQESERRRIAHDLHDSLGGLLAATRMRLDNLSGKVPGLPGNEELNKIKSLLDDTIAETRQIARNLQPGNLHQFGLMKAVRDLIVRVQMEGGPAIDFQHFGDFTNLDHTLALNCYRIVQELLQNSLKHASATEILVQLTRTENELALLVEDNGTGYEPGITPKGMGTDNIAQRVSFLKGEISIQSAKGQGTSSMVTIPL